nr:uncharacterized protein LOC109155206 [Ipomoea batatas]
MIRMIQDVSNYKQESTSSIRNLKIQLAQGSISKSPIEEENVKDHVEEKAEQNPGTVSPTNPHAEKAIENSNEKANVPVYKPPFPLSWEPVSLQEIVDFLGAQEFIAANDFVEPPTAFAAHRDDGQNLGGSAGRFFEQYGSGSSDFMQQ